MEIYDHIENHAEETLLPYRSFFPNKYLEINIKSKEIFLESLLGLKLLEDLLRKTDSSFSLHALRYTVYGKPYFPNQQLFCSLAHSEGMVIATLSEQPVGIDLEKQQETSLCPQMLIHSTLLSYAGQTDWLRAWVHQEAVFKLFGWKKLEETLSIQWENLYEGSIHRETRQSFRLLPIEDIPGYYGAKCAFIGQHADYL